MLKKRVIPVVLLRNGNVVQSKGFKRYKNLGNPIAAVKRLSEWGADELIYLDISTDENYNTGRSDIEYAGQNNIFDVLSDVAELSMMPSTIGGKINSIAGIEKRLRFGADKVAINSLFYNKPQIIKEAVNIFGSQCIVASVDYKLCGTSPTVFVNNGKTNTEKSLTEWLQYVVDLGAGEVLLNSIDHDGKLSGYDLENIASACEQVNVPVIGCGGAGSWQDMVELFEQTNVSAAAAANIFHYTDQSVFLAKKSLYEQGINVRKPALYQF